VSRTDATSRDDSRDRQRARPGLRVAVLVLSDRAARGDRADASGPALASWVAGRGGQVTTVTVLPDDRAAIVTQLRSWADADAHDLILTCGGTGLSPRDVTPEATLEVVDRTVPGLAEEMRRRSRQTTPHALLSRAVAGQRGSCLILNLPGSPRAALENLAAVWEALPHAVAKLRGDDRECTL
jgi:molybdenum cofactor synthesis domain-containing protein